MLKQTIQRALPKVIGPANYERIKYYKAHRRLPDLNNPQTFNEKVCWRKIYERDPRMKVMVDKWKVKPIVAAMIGEQHVIPTLGFMTGPKKCSSNGTCR